MKKPDYKNAEPQGADAGLRYLERRVQAVFTKKRCEENAKAEGVANVRLIDTTDGCFMGRKEATLLGLGGSTLLVGKK